MKILVINCGSSSLKYQLIDMDGEKVLCKGLCERIGMDGSVITHKVGGGKWELTTDFPTHTEAFAAVVKMMTEGEGKVINDVSEVSAIGHRVVHGGEKFQASCLVTPAVIDTINELAPLAPLHNPAGVLGLEAAKKVFGENIPNVAVFDTAFHSTMPAKSYMYGLPYEYYEKFGVRRYGFHGTSHRFIAGEAPKLLGMDPKHCKLIICHLGNGSSLSAIVDGKVVDTSMGLTPLEGVLMGSRSGDVDPAVLEYIMDNTGMDIHQMLNTLNKKSGFAGMSCSSDMRDVKTAAEKGDKQAQDALDVWCYRLQKYIGAYNVAVGGADAIVFTAGIGENDTDSCAKVIEGLAFMGVKVDPQKNKRGVAAIISTDDSTIKVLRIPTNEELLIARDTLEIVSKL